MFRFEIASFQGIEVEYSSLIVGNFSVFIIPIF